MQRYNRNGEIEEIRVIYDNSGTVLAKLKKITKTPSECVACNATHCFYHIHHTELTEGYLSGCKRLWNKHSSRTVLVPEKSCGDVKYNTQSRIDMSTALKEPTMPSSEERRRLLNILFAEGED